MNTLKNKNRDYNLIDVEVVCGDLWNLNKLIKIHNDYRGIMEEDGTYSLAMYLHKFRMDSPYINDASSVDDYRGYAIATIATLPHITSSHIQDAIDNDSELYNRLEVITK
tara:strand:+ start:1898 stop:2227 length:330 start_codon:yes stop_codon:yes gene_type:complete